MPLRSADGRWLYLRGAGAAKDGARPFLDRLDLTALKTERLWQSSPPHYENLLEVLDPEAKRIVFSRESPTERPNLYLRELPGGDAKQLTDLPDPAPWFARVKGELVRYQRPDGIQLNATLYLPPGYDKERDGALPFFFWAYPREFLTEQGASQLSGSPLQFKRPARQDHLLLLALGYGVLDNPTMPIVGKDGHEPNDTYVEQLVANARAAIDHLAERGVADRNRIGIGGHSYGAFMTANLLAHSDLFRAGIARSGAYNRTLTPFGFQAEPRTYWQAAETYHEMSPFTHAPKINEPILLIHGMRDSNSGTFPVQSERMFAALKGNGGNVRYVQLPLEDHGYGARESRRHVLWEMITWLDKYVKIPPRHPPRPRRPRPGNRRRRLTPSRSRQGDCQKEQKEGKKGERGETAKAAFPFFVLFRFFRRSQGSGGVSESESRSYVEGDCRKERKKEKKGRGETAKAAFSFFVLFRFFGDPKVAGGVSESESRSMWREIAEKNERRKRRGEVRPQRLLSLFSSFFVSFGDHRLQVVPAESGERPAGHASGSQA